MIYLGTRQSKLALAQAEEVRSALISLNSKYQVEFVKVITTGDKKQTVTENISRDKKDWVKEIELAIVSGQIDFAVHSAKDVPIEIDPNTELLPVLKRRNPADILLLANNVEMGQGITINSFPNGLNIGTSSLRRKTQLLRLRKDITIKSIRGNVTSRIAALDSGQGLDGLVLAYSGLERLSLDDLVRYQIPYSEILPAVNQGILVAQYAKARQDIRALLSPLVDRNTFIAWATERNLIATLGADCRSAVGVLCVIEETQVRLYARVLSINGEESLEENITVDPDNYLSSSSTLAKSLLNRGAKSLLDSL